MDKHTTRRAIIDCEKVREYAMEFYWQLKHYEDSGLTPEQVEEMAAELERVKHERDAACADLRMHSTCGTCANAPEHYSKICCHTCALESGFMGYKWRGPCAYNGGTEND